MKHQQAWHYNKSSRDLPKLKTGDAVYVQLMPRARNWARAIVIDIISNRTYKVQTKVGGIHGRNRKFIKPRHIDSGHSLKTTPDPVKDIQHSGPSLRPRRSIRKPQRLIESMNYIRTQYRDCSHSPGHFQNFDRLQYRDNCKRVHKDLNQSFDRSQHRYSHNNRVYRDFNHSHGHS